MLSTKPTQCAQDNLCSYSPRHVSSWIRQFLRHVGYRIWRTNRKGAIEHASQECDPIVPAHRIILAEVTPNGRVTSMYFRHRCNHDDGYQSANNYEEQPNLVQYWQQTVSKHHKRTAGPGD